MNLFDTLPCSLSGGIWSQIIRKFDAKMADAVDGGKENGNDQCDAFCMWGARLYASRCGGDVHSVFGNSASRSTVKKDVDNVLLVGR